MLSVNKDLQHVCAELSSVCTFLPRDAMHSANYAIARCPSVHLSVCLSHAGILLNQLNISSNFFSPLDSHTILVSPYETVWQYCDRDPPIGGVECRRWFSTNTSLYLENYTRQKHSYSGIL